MKILRIGDPHCRLNNLEESENLAHFIHSKILELHPDRIEILGDLHHTHGVMRMEVLQFWDQWLDIFSEICELYVLVGNHDISVNEDPDKRSYSSLAPFLGKNKNLKIISLPKVDGIYAYMPYCSTSDYFIQHANICVQNGAKVLICHQTFMGSQYENGFYAPDGIDGSKVNFPLIISGHIHKRQILKSENQTIIYPGTPKWDNSSDANEDKGIWLYEHSDIDGSIIKEEFISTEIVCVPIIEVKWLEGEEKPRIKENTKTTVELVGSSKWVEKAKDEIKGKVSLKIKITDKLNNNNRKIENTFSNFIKNNFESNEDKTKLLKCMKELNIV